MGSHLLVCMILCSPAPGDAIDLKTAAQYFTEAEALSKKDAGKLWGIALHGPMIFVDPGSRMAVANQADGEGRLTAKGPVFVGEIPPDVPTANTAARWAGVEWTMINWPLPLGAPDRARLMAHELYHRVQDDLGFSGARWARR
jgi:hypothetical protein